MVTIRVLTDDRSSHPSIRTIRPVDLRNVLAKGVDDFMPMPSHVVFLSLIYPISGVVLARVTFGSNLIYLLFPLTAGFAFIGPFAAIGLYEMSRRREAGLTPPGGMRSMCCIRARSTTSLALRWFWLGFFSPGLLSPIGSITLSAWGRRNPRHILSPTYSRPGQVSPLSSWAAASVCCSGR